MNIDLIKKEVAGALARAYCHPENEKKVLDDALIKSMVEEVMPIFFNPPKTKWDGLCRCGHRHSEHGISHSINYTAGKCSKCVECKNFVSP
jgi:hypothetical protein